MWSNYIRIGFRNLLRFKGFSFLNILGLSIGIAVSLLLLLWVQGELRYDRFHSNLPNLYQVLYASVNNGEEMVSETISYRFVPELIKEFPEIIDGARIRNLYNIIVSYDDKTFTENSVILTEPGFFSIFDFTLLAGDPVQALEEPRSVILSESTAHKLFGDQDPMGKSIMVSNTRQYEVTGIVQDAPLESSIRYDYIFPLKLLGEDRINSWSYELQGYIQIAPNTDIAALREKVLSSLRDFSPRDVDVSDVHLQAMSRIHLYDNQERPAGLIYVILFSVVGIIILIIACINYLNMAMARALTRTREVGIRKVVGAGRNQVIQQFMVEAAILVIISITLALLLAQWVYPTFNNLAGSHVSLSLNNPVLLLGIPLIIVFTVLVAGLYPAVYLSSVNSIVTLKGGTGSHPNQLFRKALLVFQFFATLTLLICTFVIMRQFDYIYTKDLGFNKDNVICVPYHNDFSEKKDTIRQRLTESSHIRDLTFVSTQPNNVGNINPANWEGKPNDEVVIFFFLLTDDHYLNTMDIELLDGRNFSEEAYEPPNCEYILNEKAISIMGIDDPIGKRFDMYGREGTIIGVIKDYHNRPLSEDIQPLMINTVIWTCSDILIKIAPDDIKGTLEYIESVFREISPDIPFQYSFLDDNIRQNYAGNERTRDIISWFTLFAAFISCVGLFGLSSFIAQQKTREIGIRKVLGSSSLSIVTLLMREFLILLLISIPPAIIVSWYFAGGFLNIFRYHTKMQWYDFLLPIMLVFSIAVATLSYRVIRAARINPVDTLRSE